MSTNRIKDCLICRKNQVNVTIDSTGYYDVGFGPHRAVCSDSNCRKIAQWEFIDKKRLEKEINGLESGLNEEKRIHQEISNHMQTGQGLDKLYSNWETVISVLPADAQSLCRQYQNSVEEKERISRGGNYNDSDSSSSRRCDKCVQVPSNGKFYTVTNIAGSYCSDCADTLCRPSSSLNNPHNIPGKPCDQCHFIFTGETYWSVGGKGYYCGRCKNKVIEQNSPSPSTNTPQEIPSNLPSQNNPPKQKLNKWFTLIKGTKKEVMDYAKKLIREGNSVDEIDTSPLSNSEKNELREYERKGGSQPRESFFSRYLLLVILVPIIILISSIVLIRRKKRLNRLKKGK